MDIIEEQIRKLSNISNNLDHQKEEFHKTISSEREKNKVMEKDFNNKINKLHNYIKNI